MKKLLAALAFGLGVALGTAPVSAAIVVTFTPAAQHMNVGDTANVEVSISGLGAEILSAFDLNFVYDGSILDWSVIVQHVGSQLGALSVVDFDTDASGNLGFQGYATDDDATLAANQANDFLMFTFSMTGLKDGVTSFTLGADPNFQRNFVGLDALSLDVTVIGACIAVGKGECAQVPEPSTLSLLGLVLAGGALIRMRRRRLA